MATGIDSSPLDKGKKMDKWIPTFKAERATAVLSPKQGPKGEG